MEAAL
jgi:hypothetical protein